MRTLYIFQHKKITFFPATYLFDYIQVNQKTLLYVPKIVAQHTHKIFIIKHESTY
jgi:flagellar biosynthesis protein FliQ